MRTKAVSAALFGILALSTNALAQPDYSSYYSRAFLSCADHDVADADGVQCLTPEIAHWDGALNEVYRERMANLSPERQLALRADERAWIHQKDKQCAASGPEDLRGSMKEYLIDSCLLDETIGRTLYLRSYR